MKTSLGTSDGPESGRISNSVSRFYWAPGPRRSTKVGYPAGYQIQYPDFVGHPKPDPAPRLDIRPDIKFSIQILLGTRNPTQHLGRISGQFDPIHPYFLGLLHICFVQIFHIIYS